VLGSSRTMFRLSSLPCIFLIFRSVARRKRRYLYLTCLVSPLSKVHTASQDLGDGHMIVDDGYNIGRDYLVEKAVGGGRWKVCGLRAAGPTPRISSVVLCL